MENTTPHGQVQRPSIAVFYRSDPSTGQLQPYLLKAPLKSDHNLTQPPGPSVRRRDCLANPHFNKPRDGAVLVSGMDAAFGGKSGRKNVAWRCAKP
jgi:hypothetical protein